MGIYTLALLLICCFLADWSNGDFQTEEEYLLQIQKEGRYSFLPFVQTLLHEYNIYSKYTTEIKSFTCPLLVHEHTPSTIELESWCGTIDVKYYDYEYIETLVNIWENRREVLEDILLTCAPSDQGHEINFPVQLPDGKTRLVRSYARNCFCKEYSLNMTSTQSGNSTRQTIQAIKTSTQCQKPANRLADIGPLPGLKKLTLYQTQITGMAKAEMAQFPNLLILKMLENPTVSELLEPGLLCGMENLFVFYMVGSFGNLRTFPSQIFQCDHGVNIKFIYLEDHNFTVVPNNAFAQASSSVTHVSLTRNNISSIEREAFYGMHSLKYLSILYNNVLSIDHGLPILPSLNYFQLSESNSTTDLNLTSLQISEQPNLQLFSYGFVNYSSVVIGAMCSNSTVSSLTMIQLTYTNISVLPDDFLGNCVSLQYLSMNGNKLHRLRSHSFPTALEKLTFWSTAGNKLDEHSDWFEILSHMPNLKILNVSMNSISEWAVKLTIISNLQQLDMSKNQLTFLAHETFQGLVHLEFLDLSDNKLQHMHADMLLGLVQLAGIYLDNNDLDEISNSTLRDLTNLRVLGLSFNGFLNISLELPSDSKDILLLRISHSLLDDCPRIYSKSMERKIRTFDVTSNRIQAFPRSCMQNVTYTTLLAEGNRIQSVGTPICSRTPCEKVSLHLSHNNLNEIFLNCSLKLAYAMVNLSSNNISSLYDTLGDPSLGACDIGVLDLSWNQLGPILVPNEAFIISIFNYYNHYGNFKLHRIDKLILLHCSIKSLAKVAFQYINFRELDLRHNPLSFLQYELQLPPGFPHVIHLPDNTLLCGCGMSWLKRALLTPSTTQYVVQTCLNVLLSEPDKPVFQKITEVADDQFLCTQVCDKEILKYCSDPWCFSKDNLDSRTHAIKCSGNDTNSEFPGTVSKSNGYLILKYFRIPILRFPFSKSTDVFLLNLEHNGIVEIPSRSFMVFPHLRNLILSNNHIKMLTAETYAGLNKLEQLFLEDNAIASLGDTIFSPLYHMSVLHLHNNALTSLSRTLLEKLPQRPLKELTLHNNPWHCVCNDTFQYFIIEQEGIVQKPLEIMCNNTGEPVIRANLSCPTDTILQVIGHARIAVAVPSAFAFCVTLMLLSTLLMYKYHTLILVVMNMHFPGIMSRFRKQTAFDELTSKDVFVIYDDSDREVRLWVKDVIIEELEPQYELICYDRDFLPGIDMAENIESAVTDTNCTVVLISERTMENPWTLVMVQSAFNHMLEHSYRVILVLMEGVKHKQILTHENCSVELATMLKANMYLKVHQRLFWETLTYKLPPPISERDLAMSGVIHNTKT